MKEKKVAIVITTFNQLDLLEKCLDSLKIKTDYKNYSVFVVDDSGKGDVGKIIAKKYKYLDVTINKKNLGFSKANNIGIKKALSQGNPDYVLLLNDDTEMINKDWLTKLIKHGESDKKIGILGCRILYEDRSMQNIGGYMKKWELVKELKDRTDIFEVDHVMGAFLLIKKKVIESIGLLDESYTPYLLEDTDYCLSAKRAGFKCISMGNVSIIHKKGRTIDSLNSKKKTFIRFKNDILFSCKNLSLIDALFRIFIYLPMVAIFRKKTDEAELKMKNFVLRSDFLLNLGILFLSFIFLSFGLNRFYKSR